MTQENKEYLEALRNLWNKSDLVFPSFDITRQILIYKVFFENTEDDVFIACDSLNGDIFNDDIVISAISKFLKGNKKLYIISNYSLISDKMLELYKKNLDKFEVYKGTDEVLRTFKKLYNPGYDNKMVLVSSKGYLIRGIQEETSETKMLTCFKSFFKRVSLKRKIKKFLPKLNKIDFLTKDTSKTDWVFRKKTAEEKNAYKESINRFARDKNEFVFLNSELMDGINTIEAMLKHSDGDISIYDKNLDSVVYRNEVFIEALRGALKLNRQVRFIVYENKVSDEILSLQRSYGFEIKQASQEMLDLLKEAMLNQEDTMETFIVTDNMFRTSLVNVNGGVKNINCFNNEKTPETLRMAFDKFFDSLYDLGEDETNEGLPEFDDVLYKFRGVDIEEQTLRDIVEFAQGKTQ